MAATAAGASAGTAATIGTIASIGLTAASAFSSINAGKQQAASLKLQARQQTANALSDRLQGRQQALQLQEQLDRDLASQNAMFAARSTLQGEGSALAAQETAQKNATRDIDLARFNADISALSNEQAAANSRADAKAAKTKGYMDALQTIGSYRSPSMPGIEDMSGQGSGYNPKKSAPPRKPSLVRY
nr:MAG TPA: hypothetical protein [Caudoviricetes sp.]